MSEPDTRRSGADAEVCKQTEVENASPGTMGTATLQTVVDTAPTAAMIVAEDGRVALTNTKLEALFGYTRAELANQQVELLVPKDTRTYHSDLREAFFEYPSSRSMGTGRDLYGVSKDGENIPLEIGLHPIKWANGFFTMATVVDIRERKRHEERFRTALDAAPSAILMVDTSGGIVLCNALVEEVFGYAREELLGKPIEILVPNRLHRKHDVYRSSYIQNPERRSMGAGKNLFGRRADGTEFPVEVALQPVVTDDGSFVISSVLDVSDRKAKQDEIHQKNEELAAFAYSTSHDLKAPLASILGLAQCSKDDLKSNRLNEVSANIERIENLAGKLSNLVEDVLSIALADAVDQTLETFRVDDSIRGSVEKHSQLRASSGVSVDFSAVDAIEVELDRRRFESIIDNLLSNAIRYADPNKPHRQVAISAARSDGTLSLNVKDNGIGIPEGMRQRVFQMFERVSASGPPGSGLGLALVVKHLDRMGGEIQLDIEDSWTVFSILIPNCKA